LIDPHLDFSWSSEITGMRHDQAIRTNTVLPCSNKPMTILSFLSNFNNTHPGNTIVSSTGSKAAQSRAMKNLMEHLLHCQSQSVEVKHGVSGFNNVIRMVSFSSPHSQCSHAYPMWIEHGPSDPRP